MLQNFKKEFVFPAITLEYGNITYGDWIFHNFLLNQENQDTFHEVSSKFDTQSSNEELLASLVEKLGKPVYIYHDVSKQFFFHFCDLKTFYIKFSMGAPTDGYSRCHITAYSFDKTFAYQVLEQVVSAFTHVMKSDSIYVISTGGDSLVLNSLGSLKYSFVRDNYEEKVLKGFDYVVSEYNKNIPSGRITIVNGPPGGGKTNLLKGIISAIENSIVVLLPAKFVVDLDSPNIVSLLLEERQQHGHFNKEEAKNKPILFIIEDADDCLVPRDGSNMSTISSLLNYTDGIFGSMLDLRIIATTNADHMDFDKALLRPGRLCRHIVVEPLSPEKASVVYKRLSGGKEKNYTKNVTLAQVYADVGGDYESAEIDKKTVGF